MCARGCVLACVRVHASVCVGAQACACACIRVALLTQHAKCMRSIMLSSVASLAPPHFLTLPDKQHDFRRKVIEHKMRVLTSSTTLI